MKCPACAAPLLSMFYEGVRVRLCGGCNGVFVGHDELKVIVHRQEVEIPRDRGLVAEQGEEVERTCPRCAVSMQKPRFRKQITLDRCPQCKGIWLDRGELEDIQLIAELAATPDQQSSGPTMPASPVRADAGAPAPARPEPPTRFPLAPLLAVEGAGEQAEAGTGSPAPAPAEPEMTCPRCRTLQPERAVCRGCGLVIADFEASAADARRGADDESRRIDAIFGTLTGFRVQEHSDFDRLVSVLDGGLRNLSFGERYDIYAPSRRLILKAEQKAIQGWSATGWGIEVCDPDEEVVMELRWGFRLFRSRVDVRSASGRRIGAIETEFSVLGRKLNVLGLSQRPILEIQGPLFRPRTFEVTRNGRAAGQIQKTWRGLLGEALNRSGDEFGATFGARIDSRRKMLILAATLFIDALYFDEDDDDDD